MIFSTVRRFPVYFESTSSDEIHFPVGGTLTIWKETKLSSLTVSESSEFRNRAVRSRFRNADRLVEYSDQQNT